MSRSRCSKSPRSTNLSSASASPRSLPTSSLTAAAASAGGEFVEGGEFTDFEFDTALTAITTDEAVGATVGVADLEKINPSKEAAILVEVCFFMNAPAPDADDVHLHRRCNPDLDDHE